MTFLAICLKSKTQQGRVRIRSLGISLASISNIFVFIYLVFVGILHHLNNQYDSQDFLHLSVNPSW